MVVVAAVGSWGLILAELLERERRWLVGQLGHTSSAAVTTQTNEEPLHHCATPAPSSSPRSAAGRWIPALLHTQAHSNATARFPSPQLAVPFAIEAATCGSQWASRCSRLPAPPPAGLSRRVTPIRTRSNHQRKSSQLSQHRCLKPVTHCSRIQPHRTLESRRPVTRSHAHRHSFLRESSRRRCTPMEQLDRSLRRDLRYHRARTACWVMQTAPVLPQPHQQRCPPSPHSPPRWLRPPQRTRTCTLPRTPTRSPAALALPRTSPT